MVYATPGDLSCRLGDIVQKDRVEAEGRADAIRSVQTAEADGIRAKLEGRAEGFNRLTEAAGSRPDLAINLLMVEQMPVLVEAQAEAIENIKIDKITVWDGAGGKNGATVCGDGYSAPWARRMARAASSCRLACE